MTIIDDWKRIAARAWSIRLALLSAMLSGIETALPYIAPMKQSGWFAAMSGLVALAAAASRIVAQPRLYEPNPKD